jgi:CubicO group peptidase (beta-lactamase class C family)
MKTPLCPFAAGLAFVMCAQQALAIDPLPAGGLAYSTPEEQGIDSAVLVTMLNHVKTGRTAIDSLLVMRNDRLVMEAYRYPYDATSLHAINSCTKSFTSALIGIAIGEGRIRGVHQRLPDFFTDTGLDSAKRDITLEDLLTMSGGFEWPGGMMEMPTLREWWQSPDWVKFVLDRPLSGVPGKSFTYNSGGSHLLSAVLERSVGMKAEDYAKEKLFKPLGIHDWRWQSDPQGISTGGFGLWLTPRDMARFGLLYLHHGRREKQQIVPAEWVSESVKKQIDAGGIWLSDGYGYQWWVDNEGYYMALGYGGQYIVVVPDRNLVMVATATLVPQEFFAPENLLKDYIVPASRASRPLPPNPPSVDAMNDLIREWSATP